MPRKSAIAVLPPELKAAIDALLKDGRLTLDQVIERVRQSYPSTALPSRSSLGRYSQRFEEVAKKLRESRAVAEVWAQKLGSEPRGDVGKVVLELLRTLSFQTTFAMSESPEGPDAKTLAMLSLAMQRIEAAGHMGIKNEKAMREAIADEVTTKLASGPRKLDEESLRHIREAIRGQA